MKLSCLISRLHPGVGKRPGGSRRVPRPRRRFRVDIVNENSLRRIAGVRLTGLQAILAAVCVVAAVTSLIAVIFMFTPAGYLLPGSLRPAERGDYTALALRVDSLSREAAMQSAYTANIRAIFTDSVATVAPGELSAEPLPADSLLEASDAERDFVRRFEQEQRFNLSVLSPIAAEGMIFEAPSPSPTLVGPVTAIYRGTVVAAITSSDGMTTLTVQHPNEFISTYGNLHEVYTRPGQKVSAGQRIGHTATPLSFELWHSGARLDPQQYIAFH